MKFEQEFFLMRSWRSADKSFAKKKWRQNGKFFYFDEKTSTEIAIPESKVVLYSTDEGNIHISVAYFNETFWLTQKGMSELFDVNIPAISKHLQNIFEDGELDKESTISKMEIVQLEGNRRVKRTSDFYNLDAIIAVGYRVNSKRATQFRRWSTETLKQYVIKGF